eukprot:11195086-Lingulodinium_polyedra.AAC.1
MQQSRAPIECPPRFGMSFSTNNQLCNNMECPADAVSLPASSLSLAGVRMGGLPQSLGLSGDRKNLEAHTRCTH